MTDASSFSSLMALVENHLSKTNLQESKSEFAGSTSDPIPVPSFTSSTLSETRLSSSQGQKYSVPKLNSTNSPITNILAEQVSNMLKAKELKKQQEEENRRLLEKTAKLKLNDGHDCIIDLMQALQTPLGPPLQPEEEILSSSSGSLESLFDPKFVDCDIEPKALSQTPEPLLPCITDMSYILDIKIQKGKGSAFGKVLTSRLKPVAAPYLKDRTCNPKITRFNFNTPSPCDIINAKRRNIPFRDPS